MAADDAGRELFPVWPHPRFAQACAPDEWSGAEPRAIDVHEFIERWVPGLDRDSRMVAVFPTRSNRGVARAPKELAEDIQAELNVME